MKKENLINAVVVDIKDFSGTVVYDSEVPEVEKYGAEEIRIPKINSMIKRFHDEGIYVIGRISVFQGAILAKGGRDLALRSSSSLGRASTIGLSNLWLDNKGLAWIDPAARPAWDYIISIAKDAAGRGFDELNFDYIRFPSDGNTKDISFPFWDKTISRAEVMRNHFRYLRQGLEGVKISADLFGQTTINFDDLTIGQIIEDAYESFDYVSPMVYPSHYINGFLGFTNPALYPYEVVKYSMESALKKLMTMTTTTSTASSSVRSRYLTAKLRPWLQDFDLGARYDERMVKLEIQAVKDALGGDYSGFMLWNPSNLYTKGALYEE